MKKFSINYNKNRQSNQNTNKIEKNHGTFEKDTMVNHGKHTTW